MLTESCNWAHNNAPSSNTTNVAKYSTYPSCISTNQQQHRPTNHYSAVGYKERPDQANDAQ